MGHKIQEQFVFFTAVILFVIGGIILLGTFNLPRAFNGFISPDPLLLVLSGRRVLFLASGLQLTLSAYLLIANPRHATIKLSLITWLATNLLLYQIGSSSIHAPNLFACLASLSGDLAVHPKVINGVAMVAFGLMGLVSCVFLAINWFKSRLTKAKPVEQATAAANVTI